MHVLYVDDSGSAGNSKENYFVLAGVAIFERRLYHLITALDRVVAGFGLDESHEIELHGTTTYNGRKEFYPVKRPEREKMIHNALSVITDRRAILRLFAVAGDKQVVSPRDPVEIAFEEISNRFNLFLQRLNNGNAPEHSQRGLIVMDETAHSGRVARAPSNTSRSWPSSIPCPTCEFPAGVKKFPCAGSANSLPARRREFAATP